MLQLLVTAALAAGPAPFEAQSLDGQVATGQIAALNEQELVLETDSGRVTFALAKLAALARTPTAPLQLAGATLWVELVDGSGLAATEYTVSGGKAQVRTTLAATLEIPTRRIRFVRFGPPGSYDPKLAGQWSQISETKAAGDLLVVRKDDALDYLEGVLGDVEAETCQFELDGEIIPVKRAKIEGAVYAHPQAAELPEAIGKLVASDGSRLELRTVKVADGRIELTTPAGTAHNLTLEAVARFDFSSGKIAYLSDLEPESVQYTPLFSFAAPAPGLLAFNAYRRDVGFEQNPLRLDGKEYRKGLSLASRSELVYKLPGKFRLFRATVGIDDSVRETGSVNVEIRGDGKPLWHEEVRGGDPAREIELEIAGVKRLEIVADYGEKLDVGDRLVLGEAQVTK
jgi:hypothetical protein